MLDIYIKIQKLKYSVQRIVYKGYLILTKVRIVSQLGGNLYVHCSKYRSAPSAYARVMCPCADVVACP